MLSMCDCAIDSRDIQYPSSADELARDDSISERSYTRIQIACPDLHEERIVRIGDFDASCTRASETR